VADIFRLTIKARHGDGTLVQPSLHYQTDLVGIDVEPSVQTIVDDVWTKIGTAFRLCCHTSVVIDELVATQEVLPPDIPRQASHAVAAAGTLTSGAFDLPKGIIPLISVKSETPSRSARSHLALACPGPTTFLTGGLWNSSVLGPAQALADLLNDDIDITHGNALTRTLHPVIYSRTRRKRGESPFTFRVSNAVAAPRPHWLRSRMNIP
jgi:hypothetical protein